MEINTTFSRQKNTYNYECEKCNYKCYKKSDYNKHKNDFLEWVARKKITWEQESMGIIIENDLYYI